MRIPKCTFFAPIAAAATQDVDVDVDVEYSGHNGRQDKNNEREDE